MSEFHVERVTVGDIVKHSNADTLGITQVKGGYPVIVKLGDFKPGDTAVYVPVDAIVDGNRPEFSFLGVGKKHRIKARKLRGVFSMGLLVKTDKKPKELGVEKYTPDGEREPSRRASVWQRLVKRFGQKGPSVSVYDIDGLRGNKRLFDQGEHVIVTEKIHGCNARYVYMPGKVWGGKFWVGSRKQWDVGGKWREIAIKYDLENICKCLPNYVVYGEVYGEGVQDLTYNTRLSFRVFDIYDLDEKKFLAPYATEIIAKDAGLLVVPTLFDGQFDLETMFRLAEGKTTLNSAGHVREGVVIKSVDGNKVLKLAGEGYLTR